MFFKHITITLFVFFAGFLGSAYAMKQWHLDDDSYRDTTDPFLYLVLLMFIIGYIAYRQYVDHPKKGPLIGTLIFGSLALLLSQVESRDTLSWVIIILFAVVSAFWTYIDFASDQAPESKPKE
ncbi:hypothetical protein LZ24_03463 [Desulfobotulus alkaliphilus]|uniref:Uncharacterized protein n=1 Tax=Desulfobotulus alkaliphilus TaxID=622671 RepID=A0A562QY89_9BACT|nr:hypothetical protein [Desulfobotulus alkaliphilus]TWI61096.1 hypothetical protein LZ24_03463 [Desulfobotulus alkaliphilus]